MSRAVYFALDKTQSATVDLRSLEEVGTLLRVPPKALTSLPYGPSAELFMVAAAQLDDTPINRNASLVAQRFGGLSVAVRGDAVAFPEGVPWQ